VLLLAALIVAVTTAAAVGSSLRHQRLYGGVADVFISTQSASTDGEAQRMLETQRVIMTSERVLGPVATAQRVFVTRLQGRVTVGQVGNSDILRITVGDPDRVTARRLAQAVADTYVANRLQSPPADSSVEAHLQERIEELSRSLSDINTRVAALQADRGPAPAGLEENQLQIQASHLVRDISTLQDRLLAEALRPGVPDDARVVAPARLLDDPLEPRPIQAGAEGLLVGCMIATGLILLWRMLSDGRLRTGPAGVGAPVVDPPPRRRVGGPAPAGQAAARQEAAPARSVSRSRASARPAPSPRDP
jgi:uncharacterized protein involved in exopolysaccharide biosynthesis